MLTFRAQVLCPGVLDRGLNRRIGIRGAGWCRLIRGECREIWQAVGLRLNAIRRKPREFRQMLAYHVGALTLHGVPVWNAFCVWFLGLPLP